MRVTVEKIIYRGKSLARAGGKVVMSDEGLPGETIEVEPVKEKKNYTEARTTGVINPSPRRTPPRCGHYRICSPYQYMDYGLQTDIKKTQVKSTLSHHLKLDLGDITFRPSPKIWNYRNKLRLHVVREDNKPFLAYHQPGEKDRFVKIKECFLATEGIMKAFGLITAALEANPLPWIEEMTVRENSGATEMLLVLHGRAPGDLSGLRDVFSGVRSALPLNEIVIMDTAAGKQQIIDGKGYIEEHIGEKTFHIGADSFFQVNTGCLETLIKDMKDVFPSSGKERIIDLYAGVGLFSVIFSDGASEITGVEISNENIDFFKRNIKLNGAGNIAVKEGSCGKWMPQLLKKRTDILIVDPPRQGLGDDLCNKIIKAPPGLIAYISCDLATLTRDLKVLLGHYRVKKVIAYDFFPHTVHIETLVLLEI